MSIDAMKHALEALEDFLRDGYDTHSCWLAVGALRLAIEQAEQQGPVVNIELSRRMAAVKVSNFYGSIIKDAEKEIERLHGLVLQHTAPPQPEKQEPVGQLQEDVYGRGQVLWFKKPADLSMLYTAPPQRQPLTDEEIRKFADTHLFYQPEGYEVSGIFNLARAIERAHGIGGKHD